VFNACLDGQVGWEFETAKAKAGHSEQGTGVEKKCSGQQKRKSYAENQTCLWKCHAST
jgi:hypothetical protein